MPPAPENRDIAVKFLSIILSAFVSIVLYFNNIIKPALQSSCNLSKTFHRNWFILAHFSNNVCTYACNAFQFGFCQSPVYQQFPQAVITVCQRNTPLAASKITLYSIAQSVEYFKIFLISRDVNFLLPCPSAHKCPLRELRRANLPV